jgi:hypothetical protein
LQIDSAFAACLGLAAAAFLIGASSLLFRAAALVLEECFASPEP